MAVCDWRTLLLVVCILQLIVTIQRQAFDFLGYMWLPIVANFVNIILIIFGCFGAVQYITKYLIAYVIWSSMWFTWNVFLICYYLNLGTLNRENGFLSLGTGSVSWWEGNGWGCQPVWTEVEGPGSWRPSRVDGCLLYWPHIELAQSALAAILTTAVIPLTIVCAYRSFKSPKSSDKKSVSSRQPVYTIELSPTEATVTENSLKPMTPRRVKRRSGSRGTGSSVRRSRRSYRNAGYLASTTSLPRDARASRPTSAHSSYSNFHAARPASYHVPEPSINTHEVYDPPPPLNSESVPVLPSGYDPNRGTISQGYDVVGPYKETNKGYDQVRAYDNMQNYDNHNYGYGYDARRDMMVSPIESTYEGSGYGSTYPTADNSSWDAPPPPAPPYGARATPQAPGPPAYQPASESYKMGP